MRVMIWYRRDARGSWCEDFILGGRKEETD